MIPIARRPEPARISTMPRASDDSLSLADALDRILHRGVAVQGNLTIGLADVDLLFLDLRLLLGSIDAIWPEGRPPVEPIRPNTQGPAPSSPPPPLPTPPPPPPAPARVAPDANWAEAGASTRLLTEGGAVTAPAAGKGSSTAQGLVKLVLTIVKLLHDTLERQAVRRMEGGRLTDTQVEKVGAALLAQADEIERLRRFFGFSNEDLALDLDVPGGTL